MYIFSGKQEGYKNKIILFIQSEEKTIVDYTIDAFKKSFKNSKDILLRLTGLNTFEQFVQKYVETSFIYYDTFLEKFFNFFKK